MIDLYSKIVGVEPERILGNSRKVPLPDLRHMYWKLLKDNTDYTWQAIGELSNRHHATVIYGVNKVNDRLKMGDKRIVEMWDTVKNIPERIIMERWRRDRSEREFYMEYNFVVN